MTAASTAFNLLMALVIVGIVAFAIWGDDYLDSKPGHCWEDVAQAQGEGWHTHEHHQEGSLAWCFEFSTRNTTADAIG